jgi:hypothetical protein
LGSGRGPRTWLAAVYPPHRPPPSTPLLDPPPAPQIPHPSAMEFMIAILRGLQAHPEASMSDVVYEQYYATLNRWHGFLASSAFSVRRGPGRGEGGRAAAWGPAFGGQERSGQRC